MASANQLVSRIKAYAAERYETGGDAIVECFDDAEIENQFSTFAEAVKYIDSRYERQQEIREERALRWRESI